MSDVLTAMGYTPGHRAGERQSILSERLCVGMVVRGGSRGDVCRRIIDVSEVGKPEGWVRFEWYILAVHESPNRRGCRDEVTKGGCTVADFLRWAKQIAFDPQQVIAVATE